MFALEIFMAVPVSTWETVVVARPDLNKTDSAFEQAARSLTGLYRAAPAALACDLHPDYASTRYAERSGLPLVRVQHHVAHVAACMTENGLGGPDTAARIIGKERVMVGVVGGFGASMRVKPRRSCATSR